MAFATVLFDLDGTLTDSAPGITGSMRFALAAVGLPALDDATLRSFVGPPLADSLRACCGLDDVQIQDVVAVYRRRYASVGMFENAVYPGIAELLEELHRAGRRLAVATSKLTEAAVAICDHFGLTSFFEAICGADVAGRHDSKADIVADALVALGRPAEAGPPRSVLVGDRSYDVVGARANGIECIGVAWGYAMPAELLGAGAGTIVADVDELAVILGVAAPQSGRSGDEARA